MKYKEIIMQIRNKYISELNTKYISELNTSELREYLSQAIISNHLYSYSTPEKTPINHLNFGYHPRFLRCWLSGSF